MWNYIGHDLFILHCCKNEGLIIAIIEDIFVVDKQGNVLHLTTTSTNQIPVSSPGYKRSTSAVLAGVVLTRITRNKGERHGERIAFFSQWHQHVSLLFHNTPLYWVKGKIYISLANALEFRLFWIKSSKYGFKKTSCRLSHWQYYDVTVILVWAHDAFISQAGFHWQVHAPVQLKALIVWIKITNGILR